MADLGRMIVGIGLALVVAGALLVVLSRLGWSLPLGRLPGDIVVERRGTTFYFPLTTSILVSLALSLLLYILRR